MKNRAKSMQPMPNLNRCKSLIMSSEHISANVSQTSQTPIF